MPGKDGKGKKGPLCGVMGEKATEMRAGPALHCGSVTGAQPGMARMM